MDRLYNRFLTLFEQELKDLQIGYTYNVKRLKEMKNLRAAIFLLEHKEMSRSKALKIIEIFD